MNEWWWGFLFGFCFCCFRRTHTPLHILCHICQSCVRLPNTPQIFKLHRYACIDTWAESPCEWLSSSRDRQLICHWNLYLEWVLWTFKDGEFFFYNVPWKNVLHWNRGAFFFCSLRWPVFHCSVCISLSVKFLPDCTSPFLCYSTQTLFQLALMHTPVKSTWHHTDLLLAYILTYLPI